MIDNLVIGIVSGLVTGILIWLFRSVWIKILSPMLEDFLYSGVRIDGRWNAKLEDVVSTHKEEIIIKQWGNRINGTIKCIEGQDQGNNYIFEGNFKNLILTATYESTNKYATDRGTFTVKMEDNGKTLKGHTVYLGDTDGELSDAKYIWQKNT